MALERDDDDERVESEPPHWAVQLVRWLDDGLVVPGTDIRLGLDGILGFFLPVVGDASTAIAALSLLWLGIQRGVPRITILRMTMNIAIDTVLGSIPVVGDLFDFAWKANRKNLELLERATHQPGRRSDFGDYLVVALFVLIAISAVVLPFVLTGWLLAKLLNHGTLE